MENNVNGLFYQQESNMFDMRKTGARISQLRRAASLTQAELAEKLGISCQAVSSWERGSNMPDIGKLLDLARILNTTVDALLSAQEPAAPVPEKEEAPQAKSAVIEESKEEVAEPSQPEPAQAGPAQPEAAQQTPPSVFNQDWLNQLNKRMEQLQQQMQEMEKLRAAMAAMPTVNIIHSAAKAAQPARPARPASASINQMAAAMMNQEQLDQLAAQADPDESEDLLTSILPHLSQAALDNLASRCDPDSNEELLEEMLPFLSQGR